MTKFIINSSVTYISEQHRLIPIGKRGSEVVLNIPASRCLQLLLLRPGTVISQQDFFKFAWQSQGQYVTTNTFYQNISILRKGLVTSGIKVDVIRTVPKEGLLFSGHVLILDVEKESKEEKDEQEGEISNEDENICNKEKTKNLSLKLFHLKILEKLALLNPLIILMVVIFMVFLLNDHTKSNVFFQTHRKITDINQCSVYVNRSELRLTNDGYIRFLKSKNVVCRPDQFIYITDDQRGASKVVQRCDTRENDSYECEVLYPVTTDVKS